MIPEYSSAPAFYIRSWVSSMFLNSGIIDQANYNNIDPVIPVQDIDRTSEQLGKLPYIVYTYTPAPAVGDKFFVKEGLIYFSIFAVNFAQLVSIGEFLVDALDRQDLTANDINGFSNIESINFLRVKLIHSEIPIRMEEVQGRYLHSLCFSYEYTRQMTDNGQFAF